MKIRTRLAILFTVITATILLIFVIITFLSSKSSREKEFYDLLKKEAITKANLFFKTGIKKETLQNIYRSNRSSLNEVEVAIYTPDNRLLYHDAVEIDYVKETSAMIDLIYQKGEITFYQKDWQVVGILYEFEGEFYIITATAYDQYGYNQLNTLLRNSVLFFIVSILLIYIAGIFFSKKALTPVSNITDKVREISAKNLDLRLDNSNNSDELSELSNTFNEMLDRLENSFESQKHFVSNIAHELRTPLTSVITELELSNNKEQNIESYQNVIANILTDAKKIARLLNSLLDLAKASYDPSEISFKQIRVDEVLLDARQKVKNENPDFKIDIHFEDEFENDEQISVKGNEYLLEVAFSNLFENGCKFSDNKQCVVFISFTVDTVVLKFRNSGIGILEEDLPLIFTPFYRGHNKDFVYGNGIGLSLVQKIVTLHKGRVSVMSSANKGAAFTVELPHL